MFFLVWACACWPALATASLFDALNGYADLTAVQSEVSGLHENTLRQEYRATLAHRPHPLLDLRAGLRYYKFDQELDIASGSNREELQPSGEARWDHPLFVLSMNAQRRRVQAPFTPGLIITNDWQSSLKTRDTRYPLLGLRWDDQHTYSTESLEGRDIQDIRDIRDIRHRRHQLTLDYTAGVHILSYAFSRDNNENVISGLQTTRHQHQARWNGSGRLLADGRLRLNGNYAFQYSSQSDEVATGITVLEPVPILQGLYALDDAPDNGTLVPRSGLADGNLTNPVLPLIDIGGTLTDHNLGTDLGGPQQVAALYVYTDGPSGSQVRWQVYTSLDNINWQLWEANPQQLFNTAMNRYELQFSAAFFRYIKVVNYSLNEVASVHITEIAVFRELVDIDTDRRIRVAHIAAARAGYRFSPNWDSSLDLAAEQDQTQGAADTRQRLNYAWRLRFRQSDTITHHLRWEQSWQDYENEQQDLRDDVAAYTLALNPLPTLRGSLALNDRTSYISGVRSQDVLSGSLEGQGDLLYDLALRLGGGLSRNQDHFGDRELVTGNVRLGLVAALTSALDLNLEQTFQQTTDQRTDEVRTRRFTSLGVDWKLTRTVYLRGSLRYLTENAESLVHDLLLSWNATPRLRMSLQSYAIDYDGLTTTLRQSFHAGFDLNSRSSLYVRVTEVDLTGGGGTRTVSYQQGLRYGF